MEIHQFVAGFASGDAISINALYLQSILRKWGHNSKIFSIGEHISRDMRAYAEDYKRHSKYSGPKAVAIYHFSIGSELSNYFKFLPDKKLLIYHNITPAKYFYTINETKAKVLSQGREELASLADVPDLSLADSEYNRRELAEAGFKNTEVLPLTVDLNHLNDKPSRKIISRYRDQFVNLLFVGRMVPNKRFEDIIKVFYYYKKVINRQSRLLLVGAWGGCENYLAYLRGFTAELELSDVVFTGAVKFRELLACYRLADVFICMSEHEGFCIPLLEAMHFHIPIVAFSAAAVPETLGGAGLLVKRKNYEEIAELVDLLVKDKHLRQEVLARQNERLKDFAKSGVEEKFKGFLERVTNSKISPY